MIIDLIKQKNLQALKDKNTTARTIYSIVLNKFNLLEIERRSQKEGITKEDEIRILAKTIKELTEEADNYKKVGNTQDYENILLQRKILEEYLPKMLTEEEIKQIILNLPDKTIPFVMKYFKDNYAGKCDMSLVSKVARTLQ